MKQVQDWSRRADDRDLSDAANEWAEFEATLTPPPDNAGAWKASLQVAFEAGRMFERARIAQ